MASLISPALPADARRILLTCMHCDLGVCQSEMARHCRTSHPVPKLPASKGKDLSLQDVKRNRAPFRQQDETALAASTVARDPTPDLPSLTRGEACAPPEGQNPSPPSKFKTLHPTEHAGSRLRIKIPKHKLADFCLGPKSGETRSLPYRRLFPTGQSCPPLLPLNLSEESDSNSDW